MADINAAMNVRPPRDVRERLAEVIYATLDRINDGGEYGIVDAHLIADDILAEWQLVPVQQVRLLRRPPRCQRPAPPVKGWW